MLPLSQYLSTASEFQILLSHLKAVFYLCHVFKPFLCGFTLSVRYKYAVGLVSAPSYPSPQLVQLSHTEPVGILYNHYGGIRDINPYFYHCSRHKYLCFLFPEALHHFILFICLHFSMEQAHLILFKILCLYFLAVLHCRVQLQLLRLLHERTYKICLSSCVKLLFDEIHQPFLLCSINKISLHLFPAWRHFVYD